MPFLSTFQILPVRLCVLSSPPPPCPGNASSSWCLWCASPSAHSNSTCACAFKEMVAPPRPPPPSPRSSPSLAPAVEWPRSTGPAAAANSKSTYSARGISCSSVGVAPVIFVHNCYLRFYLMPSAVSPIVQRNDPPRHHPLFFKSPFLDSPFHATFVFCLFFFVIDINGRSVNCSTLVFYRVRNL